LTVGNALSATTANGAFTFYWAAVPGHFYQVQFKTSLNSEAWIDLGASITAPGPVVATSFGLTNVQSYYRIVRTQ